MKEETLNEMTVQEACDYAVAKIVEQCGRCTRSDNNEISCAYGNQKGRHCAVGWLLDEDNAELMGFKGNVDGLISKGLAPKFISNNRYVLRTLQQFHDTRGCPARGELLIGLNDLGVDTSAPQYKDWVDMGDLYVRD